MTNILNIIIKGTDQISDVAAGAGKSLDNLATTVGARMSAIGASMTQVGGMMTAGLTLPLVALGAKTVGLASDLAETTSKINVLFGESATQIESWAATSATAFGQSKQQAMDAAATFATFGKSAGLSGTELVGFSTKMTGLASDLASFNNTSPEQAIVAIGAALRGETEPIRQYGVLLDDASMRNEAMKLGLIATTKDALTPQQKVLAAQSLILAQTSAAQGDFIRTSDGLANQQRILKAKLADTGAELGAKLLPLALKLVEKVSALVDWFSGLSDGTQGWIVKIGLLVAVLGPVISFVGMMASGIGAVMGLIGGAAGLSAIVGGLGTALAVLTGPIGLVVGAVALLATAWTKDWGGIQTKTKEALGWMKDKIGDYWKWSQETSKKLRSFFTEIDWGEIGSNILEGIVKIFFDGPKRVFDALKNMFSGAFSKIKDWLGIRSPSTMAAKELGLPIAMGIGAGIRQGMPAAMRNVTTNNYFSVSLVGGASAGQDVLNSVQLLSALYG